MHVLPSAAFGCFYLLVSQSSLATAELSENPVVQWLSKELGLSESGSNDPPAQQPLKVFSAGLSRTGTMSLRAAMIDLGYNPWHSRDFDPISKESMISALLTGDASQFFDILQSQGYNSSVEFMFVPLVREALARYPDSRVVLTVRDSAEKWVASMADFYQVWRYMQSGTAGMALRHFGIINETVEETMICSTYATLVGDAPTDIAEECDPARVKLSRGQVLAESDLDSPEVRSVFAKLYTSHNSAVRALVPPERLLEFNVKQGYGPLCRFLEIPVENCPAEFPWLNEGSEMRMVGRVLLVFNYGWWVPVLIVLLLLRRCFARKAEKLE